MFGKNNEKLNLALGNAKKHGITYEQKLKVKKWAKAALEVSNEVLEKERDAWIESLLNILNDSKVKNDD